MNKTVSFFSVFKRVYSIHEKNMGFRLYVVLSFFSYVNLGKLLHISKSQFPHVNVG